MAQAKFRGRFVWQELMTGDTAAASAFYTKLLGWHVHASGGDPAYTEFHAGSKGVAGMMKMPDSAKSMGAKPMWMPYITVDEVAPAVTEIEHLGGKTVRAATDIPNVGRFAVMSDPQGAVFAVMKPMGPPPLAPAPPQPGEFSWMELATTDNEAAFTFYAKVFGWQALHRHDMGPMGTYLIFGSDGIQRGGIFKMAPQHGSHPYWLPYASVADADASAAVVTASGGRIVNGPMDVPDGGRIAQLTDPGGVLFAVHSQTNVPAAKPAAPAQSAAPPPKPAVAPPPLPKPVPPPPKPIAAPPPPKPVPPPPPKLVAPPPAPKAAPVTTPPTLKPAMAASKPAAAPAAAAKRKAATKKATKKKGASKKKVATKKKAKKAPAKKKVARKASKATKPEKAKKGKKKVTKAEKKAAKAEKKARRKSGKAKRKK